MIKNKKQKRIMRHKRIRAKVEGTAERPRLSVFKSNKHFYIQLIDDGAGKTLVSVSDKESAAKTPTYELGGLLAKKAKDAGIKTVVFDRGGYKFHGTILQIADGARDGGLKF